MSNQTSQPLAVLGERLAAGAALELGPPISRALPLVVLDARHAYARLPEGVGASAGAEAPVPVRLAGGDGEAELRLINDVAFPDLTALAASPDGAALFAVSGPEDAVYAFELATRKVTRLEVGDGPSAIAAWRDGEGRGWMVVAHQFAPELRLLSVDGPGAETRTLPGPAYASGLVVSPAAPHAFVAEQARDTVACLDLAAAGRERWRTPVAPNPRALALSPKALWVGSLQTGELEALDPATGAPQRRLAPVTGTPIVGGGTAAYAPYVMGGTAPRALAFSARLGRVFVSSIGPNVGPNPQKMEVSMNGGVAAVDPARGFLRHLGFGAGVTEALALDDERGLLYATDVGLGLVRVLDAQKLAASDGRAAQALLQEVALPPPPGFPLVRPAADFNVNGRAGPSLHSGPKAAVLSGDKKTLYVLNRFTGTVAELDVSRAPEKKAAWRAQWPLTDTLGQRTRRLGQVLYFADLGRTAMSCDACHLEGHTEGVLFEKTSPLRIYRSTTVRGSRETPPYFTPASTFSLGETAKVVGGRNRFHNPDPTPEEIEALMLYSGLLPTLPNPFVGEDGAPLTSLALPDGRTGNPRAGLALFEGRADCARCHPAPLYTLDQEPATRGRFLDVGTPRALPLREALQDTRFTGFGTPSLLGAWDVFPMLTTGLAGLEVKADETLGVATRFPLRPAVERWAPTHGRADLLSERERDDLLAFVLSL